MGIPITLQRHLTEQQSLHPAASGQFSGLLWEFVLAVKMIAREVRRAGLIDILGAAGTENVHGEKQQKLDTYAQDRLEVGMARTGLLCCMASEERPEIIPIPREYPRGKYVFLFDPLDGSSNIDVNIAIGTIFSIHRRVSPGDDGRLEDCLQPGTKQIAAGYVLYGSSVMLVYTTGKGYSINEGNAASWDDGTERYVAHLKEKDPASNRPYSMRYVGTLVADFHRTLLNGGIFMYPASPKPKLRLLY